MIFLLEADWIIFVEQLTVLFITIGIFVLKETLFFAAVALVLINNLFKAEIGEICELFVNTELKAVTYWVL